MKGILVIIFLFCSTSWLGAQDLKNLTLDSDDNGKKLYNLLREVEEKYNVDFLFDSEEVNAITISGIRQKIYFNSFMDVALRPYNLKLVDVQPDVYYIVKENLRWQFGKKEEDYITLHARDAVQQKVKGFIVEDDSQKPVIGAQVIISTLGKGTSTDENGYFEFVVPKGIYQLEIQYVGYQPSSFIVGFSPLSKQDVVNRSLFLSPMELEGVIITAEGSDKNVRSIVPGIESLGIEEIKTLPTFLGEVDPVKSLTTLPGVSTAGELSSGFNVRGGDSGQNLILQDGAIIYNPSHLFGFFSAFNPDFLQDISLYKGGGPSKFGGRISSVLDINLRNGDATEHKVSGGVGLVSSRLGLEGPILKGKSSYLIGGRVSYTNWLLKATDNIQLQNSSAQFYDLTAKIFHRFNSSNFLSITAYRSYDEFKLDSDSVFSWETTNASLKWEHIFRDNLISTLSLSSSNYYSEIYNPSTIDGFTYRNSINTLWLKYDFVNKSVGGTDTNFGIDLSKTLLEPGELENTADNVLPVDIQDQNVVESAAYLEGSRNVQENIAITAGIRYSHFFRLGSDVIYSFNYDEMQGRYPTVMDTISYKTGEIIENFGGLEPRLSVRYLFKNSSSLKASYFRTYQYLHFISNTTSVTPQDYYVASGPYLDPVIGDQFSLGYFKNFRDDAFELSVEAYYKKITNVVDYIDGADITLNPVLEAGLVNGDGKAYGIELLGKKNIGKLQGWISYTYSRSLRKFASENGLDDINSGDFYPSTYDQPHNLSVILNYRLGLRSSLSANFSYSTGRPITIPVSKFNYDAYLAILNYSERNEYRIPDYHRLDISLTIEGIKKRNSKFYGEWVFSIYNLYSRNNAYSIFFNSYGKAKKLSILGSVFPSISYNFKF